MGSWSTNNNFQPSYDLAMNIPNYAGSMPILRCDVGSDSQYIYFNLDNNQTSGDVTFYFRLTAFAPPEYTGDIAPIGVADDLVFNTDYNYFKLIKQPVGPVRVAGGSSTTIAHNLGYIPQCRVWRQAQLYINDNFDSAPAYIADLANVDNGGKLLGSSIDSNNLRLSANTDFAGDASFYYQIYGDEI
jgi:hypothetical protein